MTSSGLSVSRTIARQLVIVLIVFGFSATLLTTVVQAIREYKVGLNEIHRQIEDIRNTHSRSLASSLWHFSEKQIEIELNGIISAIDVEYVELNGIAGNTWFAGEKTSTQGIATDIPLTFTRSGNAVPVGSLYVYAGKDGLISRVWSQVLNNLFNAAVWTFFLAATLFWFFRFFVTRHLDALAQYASSIQFGKLLPPLTLNRKSKQVDELDLVVNAINSMQTQLMSSIKELELNERRFREFVEGTDNLVAQFDSKGHFTYTNHVAEDIFGIDPDECIGLSAFSFIDERDKKLTREWLDSCLRDQVLSATLENRQVHRSGDVRNMIWSFNFHYDQLGQLEYANGIARDITGILRAEEDKQKLQLQLQQAQRIESIGLLAGGVAHDFNNMLGVILGHTELALMKLPANSPLKSNLEQINSAARRSADLTRQLLTFARKQAIEPKVLNLNSIVDGMLNILKRLIGENIQLEWKPSSDLWLIKVDPSQIDQILANLCANARDAIDGIGTITIETDNYSLDERASSEAGSPSGDYVRLSVIDDGKGIDDELLSHIFEPFYTTKDAGEGTGLGLATVHGAVKQNDGFVEVCSSERGTRFNIYLPKVHADVESIEESFTKQLRRGTETILLVEDDVMLLNLKKSMLEMNGYTVLSAATPADALSQAAQHSGVIHLLITDVIMPEMNGKQLAEKLLDLRPELQVVFMSGYTADIISQQGIIDAGIHFLQKPISGQGLVAKVQDVLDSSSK